MKLNAGHNFQGEKNYGDGIVLEFKVIVGVIVGFILWGFSTMGQTVRCAILVPGNLFDFEVKQLNVGQPTSASYQTLLSWRAGCNCPSSCNCERTARYPMVEEASILRTIMSMEDEKSRLISTGVIVMAALSGVHSQLTVITLSSKSPITLNISG
jgi:hypothetical protein